MIEKEEGLEIVWKEKEEKEEEKKGKQEEGSDEEEEESEKRIVGKKRMDGEGQVEVRSWKG